MAVRHVEGVVNGDKSFNSRGAAWTGGAITDIQNQGKKWW